MTSSPRHIDFGGLQTTRKSAELSDNSKLENKNLEINKHDVNLLENTEQKSLDLPINSDYTVIGNKIFRDKISFEIADSFSEDYSVNTFSSAVTKYYRFLTGESLKKYKPITKISDTTPQGAVNTDLSAAVIRGNFDKSSDSIIDTVLLVGIVNNKIPNASINGKVLVKPNSYSYTGNTGITNILQNLKARRDMGKSKILTGALEKISKNLILTLLNTSILKISIDL